MRSSRGIRQPKSPDFLFLVPRRDFDPARRSSAGSPKPHLLGASVGSILFMSRYYRHNPDEPIRHDWLAMQVAQRRYDAKEHPDYYGPSWFRCVMCGEKRHMSERVEGRAFCVECDEASASEGTNP